MATIRGIFLADTHLGFDLPRRPRVDRRRRGRDFFANFERVLEAAAQERVDFVLHGGDLLYRSRVPADLVHRAFQPLKRIADAGIPVFLVPGNHERSKIPYPMLALHPGIHVFDRPRTFTVEMSGIEVALAGFPYQRHGVRTSFTDLLDRTGWVNASADLYLLCMHQAFEGATVGPSDHTFRYESDVVRLADVPQEFAAVLSGHIHRHQILTRDLRGAVLRVPVLYPGSVERTSFAERHEPKGFLLLDFDPADSTGWFLSGWDFRRLPARPMVVSDIDAAASQGANLQSQIRDIVDGAPADAVLRIRIHGLIDATTHALIRAANLRALAPATMNIEAVLVDGRGRAGWPSRAAQ